MEEDSQLALVASGVCEITISHVSLKLPLYQFDPFDMSKFSANDCFGLLAHILFVFVLATGSQA